jgi:hypothetical protein
MYDCLISDGRCIVAEEIISVIARALQLAEILHARIYLQIKTTIAFGAPNASNA